MGNLRNGKKNASVAFLGFCRAQLAQYEHAKIKKKKSKCLIRQKIHPNQQFFSGLAVFLHPHEPIFCHDYKGEIHFL